MNEQLRGDYWKLLLEVIGCYNRFTWSYPI